MASRADRKLGPEGPLGRTPPAADGDEALRRRGLLLAAGLVGLLACMLVLALLAGMVQSQEQDALDRFATPFMHALASPGLDALMNAATLIGSDFSIVPLAIVLAGGLAWFGRHREAAFLGVTLAGSVLVNGLMKAFFHRARPSLPWAHVLPDYSFPSGHSMNSLAFGLALALIAWRLLGPRWGGVAVALATLSSLLIGASRVYLGAHYLTDVVGGYAAAILWVAIVVGVFRTGASWRGRASKRTSGGPAAHRAG